MPLAGNKPPPKPHGRRAPGAIDFGRLPEYIGYRVRLAQSAIFRDLSRSAADFGMTPGEFSLMTVLGANAGIDSVTLTNVYRLDKATLSLTLKRLTQRGLIVSERREDDRRYFSLHLTPAGREALRAATKRIERQERLMAAVLGPGERERLLELLARISMVLERR
jgi:DNA-binding MarR family transcriptional regulator